MARRSISVLGIAKESCVSFALLLLRYMRLPWHPVMRPMRTSQRGQDCPAIGCELEPLSVLTVASCLWHNIASGKLPNRLDAGFDCVNCIARQCFATAA